MFFPQAQRQTDAMVSQALDRMESLGRAACLVCGDFNQELPLLGAAPRLSTAGWADLGDRPTSLPGNLVRAPKRIDWMLASPALRARTGGAFLTWDYAVPHHAYQWLVLGGEEADRVPFWK